MTLFRRHRREMPTLNTASLPDLIFTVLFFFMIVTSMRSVPLLVRYATPEGTELSKMSRKSHIIYIYVGEPLEYNDTANDDNTVGAYPCGRPVAPVIQVNDKYCDLADIAAEVAKIRNNMSPEDAEKMCVSLKADRNVDMGTITDIKTALRRAQAYRINYSATNKKEE